MNSVNTGNNETNFLIYFLTLAGTFFTDNWYLLAMIAFGLIHVYIAWTRNARDQEKSDLEIKALKSAMNAAEKDKV
jgi:hypothetical protein